MSFKKIIILVLCLTGLLAAACSPQPTGGGSSTTSSTTSTTTSTTTTSTTSTTVPSTLPCGNLPYDESNAWWAAGDSVFAGVGWQHRGAPVHIEGLYDRSFAGDTLVKVPQLPSQPTVRSRLQLVFCNAGVVPRNMVLHVGAADLFARATWQFKPELIAYTEAITSLDTWLKSLGVQRVVWTNVIPMTYWALHAPTNPTRLMLNDWLLNSGLETIDCNGDITDDNGWLPGNLALGTAIFPADGAHLNRTGARLHAACIVEQLGNETLTLKEE